MSSQEKNDKEIIWVTTDPQGRAVSIHNTTWQHIKEKHKEIRGFGLKRIKSTVEKPFSIVHNETRCAIIYTDYTTSDLLFNVLTRANESLSQCTVSTAYLTSKAPKGHLIWQQNPKKK